MLTKTDVKGLVVDQKTNAVIATDYSKYNQIQLERSRNKQLSELEQSMKFVMSELETIRALIKTIPCMQCDK